MATRTMLSAFRNRSLTSRIISHHRSLRTLVLAEHEGGSIKTSSLSAIEAAKSLGDENSISVLLAGSGPSIKEVASQAASCHPSVSKVLLADSEKFSNPLAEPWAKLVHLVHQKAALLDVSPITDVTEISGPNLFVSGAKVAVLAKPVRTVGLLLYGRPTYAGNALSTVRYTGSIPLSNEDACLLSVVVGATRAAVDAGYVPNDLQYSNSELKCETQVADYGLVGDLFEVIPELLEKLPEKK
nr:electron transfer flavoprotein subunit alpha, mitochondrial [Ipomoea batatas]